MRDFFVLLDLNPEPWQAPQGSIANHGGRPFVAMHKTAQLEAYQNAVDESLRDVLPDGFKQITEEVRLDVWFWRRLESYQGEKRMVTKHRADRSNLLKAFEDALQGPPKKGKGEKREGVLIKNDVQIVAGLTRIVEQSKETEPRIVIRVTDPVLPIKETSLSLLLPVLRGSGFIDFAAA